MRVIIAEKPDAGKAIAKVLPGKPEPSKGFIKVGNTLVTWCIGHLLQLKDAKDYDEKYKSWKAEHLPIVPEVFSIKASPEGYKQEQLKVLRKCLDQATEVINAGDDDREGHLLVMEVIEFLGCRAPIKRMRFRALNEPSLAKALKSLEDNRNFDGWLESGKARSEADWMVGINLSRAFTCAFKRCGSDRLITVGRVQTPILAMIVERDWLIATFVPKDFYQPMVRVDKDQRQFNMSWLPRSQHGFDEEGRLIDLAVAKNAVVPKSVDEMIVTEVSTEQKREGPKALFRLVSIQAACSSLFGLDASKTLEVAQALYEKHKILSYPRTSSSYLPESMHGEAQELFGAIKGCLPESMQGFVDKADWQIKSSYFDDKKVEAHHAIIPILPPRDFKLESLSEIERQVYELVVERYLTHFFPDHLYDSTHVVAKEVHGREYEARGRVTTSLGWREVISAEEEEDEDKEDDGMDAGGLPPMIVGDSLNVLKRGIVTKTTRPPKPYTSGTLMVDLENVHRVIERRAKYRGAKSIEKLKPVIAKLKEVAGLGTDATRGKMVDNLIANEYIEKKKGKLISTPLGREIIRNVPEQIASPVMTALFEQALDKIKAGELSRPEFMRKQSVWVETACRYAANEDMKVTPFKKPYDGPKDAKPKKATGDRPKPEGPACEACGKGVMILRKGKNGDFLGCSNYPECKQTSKLSA